MPAIICIAFALLLFVAAILYQRHDMVPKYGGTMGGEMTTGVMWVGVSLFSALGSLAYFHWFFAGLVFLLVFMLSFLIRMLVARIPK
ncbi:MAG: hypothetical protein C0631_05015 [Sedimenticola sp.]|jgi:hypothetical protein|nr:MAG: hypothetical protein C0631_05015 [Sedimenticola sp.]